MKILFIGDVFGNHGLDHLRRTLPRFKAEQGIDLVIANGENSAVKNGTTDESADAMLACGVDVITGGNHTLRHRSFYDRLDNSHNIIRPANLSPDAPGKGYTVIDMGRVSVCVINLLGSAFMDPVRNPFETADDILKRVSADIIIVDFHAEATSEKFALASYLDGRVTAVIGTHTHVPTADARILRGGTAFITDVGMTGAIDSCLGVVTEQAVYKMRTGLPTHFTAADGPCKMDCAVLNIDIPLCKCTKIETHFYNNIYKSF